MRGTRRVLPFDSYGTKLLRTPKSASSPTLANVRNGSKSDTSNLTIEMGWMPTGEARATEGRRGPLCLTIPAAVLSL